MNSTKREIRFQIHLYLKVIEISFQTWYDGFIKESVNKEEKELCKYQSELS